MHLFNLNYLWAWPVSTWRQTSIAGLWLHSWWRVNVEKKLLWAWKRGQIPSHCLGVPKQYGLSKLPCNLKFQQWWSSIHLISVGWGLFSFWDLLHIFRRNVCWAESKLQTCGAREDLFRKLRAIFSMTPKAQKNYSRKWKRFTYQETSSISKWLDFHARKTRLWYFHLT